MDPYSVCLHGVHDCMYWKLYNSNKQKKKIKKKPTIKQTNTKNIRKNIFTDSVKKVLRKLTGIREGGGSPLSGQAEQQQHEKRSRHLCTKGNGKISAKEKHTLLWCKIFYFKCMLYKITTFFWLKKNAIPGNSF